MRKFVRLCSKDSQMSAITLIRGQLETDLQQMYSSTELNINAQYRIQIFKEANKQKLSYIKFTIL